MSLKVKIVFSVFLFLVIFVPFFMRTQFLGSTTRSQETVSQDGTLILQNDQTTTNVPNTDIALTLQSVSIPAKNCRDCMQTVSIRVKSGAESATLDYKSGGFAGYTQDKQSAFGYTFTLIKADESSVTLRYGI